MHSLPFHSTESDVEILQSRFHSSLQINRPAKPSVQGNFQLLHLLPNPIKLPLHIRHLGFNLLGRRSEQLLHLGQRQGDERIPYLISSIQRSEDDNTPRKQIDRLYHSRNHVVFIRKLQFSRHFFQVLLIFLHTLGGWISILDSSVREWLVTYSFGF